MCLASHLQLIINAENIILINNHHQPFHDVRNEASIVKSFSHPNFYNFTFINVITQNGVKSLFAVAKNDNLIELDIATMKTVSTFIYNACHYSSISNCDENIVINQISEITLLDHQMMWFCYYLPHKHLPSPSPTFCMIPKNQLLTSEIRWQKTGLTSNSDKFHTYTVQTENGIFIGSFVDKSLVIQKTKLPDIFGKIETKKDLRTPQANFYFEKNAKFLEAFEKEHEVYFVVVEQVSTQSLSVADCSARSDSRSIYVTRLVRICKHDNGGEFGQNEFNFGTIAKADLVCSVGEGKDEFVYQKAISASWSNDKLFVLFENQNNAPTGKVVCYFDRFAFNTVFDGRIRDPWNISPRIPQIKENPLPKVCQLLSNASIPEHIQNTAASLSVIGLYRDLKIYPVTRLSNVNQNVKYMRSFSTGGFAPSTILIFADNEFVEIYNLMENNDLCEISKYQLNKQEIANQIMGSNVDSDILVFISTNQRLIQLKINNCEPFNTQIKCLTEAPNLCGWDRRTFKCTSLTDKVDVTRWKRSTCKKERPDYMWSLPQICNIKESQVILKCSCRYCINKSLCKNVPKFQIQSCSGTVEIGKWGEWGDWSECSSETGLKTRKRKCQTSLNCVGKIEETIHCNDMNKNDLHTGWTQWFSVSNTNIFNSFRAKCSTKKLTITPILETREMFCEKSCMDNSFKWSEWSECSTQHIQYRLFNCSVMSQCPANKIQIQTCGPPQMLSDSRNEKDTNYSTIHLILAVLIASIIWVFLLIFIGIIFLKIKFKSPKKMNSGRRKRLSKNNQSSLFKRQFSETFTDYLTSDIKSTTYDIDHTDILSILNSDIVPSASKHIYLPSPLVTSQHTHFAPA